MKKLFILSLIAIGFGQQTQAIQESPYNAGGMPPHLVGAPSDYQGSGMTGEPVSTRAPLHQQNLSQQQTQINFLMKAFDGNKDAQKALVRSIVFGRSVLSEKKHSV